MDERADWHQWIPRSPWKFVLAASPLGGRCTVQIHRVLNVGLAQELYPAISGAIQNGDKHFAEPGKGSGAKSCKTGYLRRKETPEKNRGAVHGYRRKYYRCEVSAMGGRTE